MTTKIMLVEDDTNLSSIYQARLEAEGFQIITANDGEQALAMAVKERPDLIISDVMMPKISGFDMLDILRQTDGIKDTRVIMMTALGQAEDKARADKLGADRYLVKSQVTLEDVVRTVHEVLDGQPEAQLPTGATDSVALTPVEQAAQPQAPATAVPSADIPVAQPPASNEPLPASPQPSTPADIPVAQPPGPPATEPTTATLPSSEPVPAPEGNKPQPAPTEPSAPPSNAAMENDQTSKSEQTKVLSQIEDFLNTQESAATNPVPIPPPSEEKPKEAVIDPPAEQGSQAAEEPANKRVIQPMEPQPKPDLNALLAKENSQDEQPKAATPPITNTSGSIDGIISPGSTPQHAAGTVIQPTGSTGNSQTADPSSISL